MYKQSVEYSPNPFGCIKHGVKERSSFTPPPNIFNTLVISDLHILRRAIL